MESEILSDDELVDITGYKARACQIRWLIERHWVFVEGRHNRPLVGRHYTRMKLGAVVTPLPNPSSEPAAPTWVPDFSKVK
ncbi:DUF4224 domain-containing protein [Pseudomonas sp. dw_358]|uniref:DUF4224 domain-containing protein n=1 Tax=Pseudomonas sp. dw_358 TaxID=2720083 RepID=UPI001BD3463E|nr:DUF4224 domain-containing protein [Pseudomonas sp. dw_358]